MEEEPRDAGPERAAPEPAETPEPDGDAGARSGTGPPAIGKPAPVRLGEDLSARVDAARQPSESRAAAIRRLLQERLGGPTLTRTSARRAMLGIGAGLAGGEPVTGTDGHYQAIATLLDDADIGLAMRPSVNGVARTIEKAVDQLVLMLTEDDAERDRMRQVIWQELAERAARSLEPSLRD